MEQYKGIVKSRTPERKMLLVVVTGIILFLNHPSGDVLPTEDDLAVVKKAVWAGELLGISVTDSLVIGGGNGSYYSFMEW